MRHKKICKKNNKKICWFNFSSYLCNVIQKQNVKLKKYRYGCKKINQKYPAYYPYNSAFHK